MSTSMSTTFIPKNYNEVAQNANSNTRLKEPPEIKKLEVFPP